MYVDLPWHPNGGRIHFPGGRDGNRQMLYADLTVHSNLARPSNPEQERQPSITVAALSSRSSV